MRRGVVLIPACLVVAALALVQVGCESAPREHQLSGYTMGTEWSVRIVLPADSRQLTGLRDDIEDALETVDAQMSTYRDDSVLSRFNKLPAGESIILPSEFAEVLDAALMLAEQTGGRFDPTVGPLVNLWGFGPDGPRTEPPSEQAIEAARARVGWEQLQFDIDTRELFQPGDVYLDLSSIAKGYAVDLIVRRLETRGINAYLVDIGGDMRSRGEKPGGQPWRIAIERPTPGERGIHTIIEPGNKAIATSGSYRSFFRDGDREYSHTIDPLTGYPIPQELVSVTVVHDNAMAADGLATAITALGPQAGLEFARERDLVVLLLIRDNGSVREEMTERFTPYLDGEKD